MEDDRARLLGKVQDFSDVELAALCCLVAGEHCIIRADGDCLNSIAEQLQEISWSTFGLTSATLDCTEQMTLDDFGNGILVEREHESGFAPMDVFGQGNASFFCPVGADQKRRAEYAGDVSNSAGSRIGNIVIAKSFHLTDGNVQIQALELIRGRRIFTRTAVNVTPKHFLFIALLPLDDSARLIPNLVIVLVKADGKQHLTLYQNDQMFISHIHEEDLDYVPDDDISAASASSVMRSSPGTPAIPSRARREAYNGPLLSKLDIDALAGLTSSVKLSPEIRGYLHDLVVFMRLNRAVHGGVSAMATKHLLKLSHALAPLHGLEYVPPSLVALAVRKVYPHRLILTTAENEKSVQWGSELRAVAELLEGITVEHVIEDVLQTVETPL